MNQSLIRLSLLGDWIKMKTTVDTKKLLNEISLFNNEWKSYNPRKSIKRTGLSVTSFDGLLTGIPDLDSLSEYNKQHGTNYSNYQCTQLTQVYFQSEELQKVLAPYKNHLLRSHFIRLDSGGYFPPHRDCYPEKQNSHLEQIRMIFLIKNCHSDTLKFIHDNQLIQFSNGEIYYFNGNKTHTVFSLKDECIFLVVNLRFDDELYSILTREMNDQ